MTGLNFTPKKSLSLFNALIIAQSLLLTFWICAQTINVYKYILVGIVFEIIWLPAIIAIPLIPAIAFVYWIKNKCKFNSKYLYLGLACLALSLTFYLLVKP